MRLKYLVTGLNSHMSLKSQRTKCAVWDGTAVTDFSGKSTVGDLQHNYDDCSIRVF